MAQELIDSHCHLDMEPFLEDQAECVERAHTAGVTRILTIGTGNGLAGASKAISLAEKYPIVWASVGIHPHSANEPYTAEELLRLATHPRVVAIGETGLDFYRDWSPVQKQYEALELQISVARQVRKPLIIHSRNAGPECLEFLKNHRAHDVGGVFHCFSEDANFARRLEEIGFLVSFPGQLTFKKADQVRTICREIPIEHILVETDAPFLAPEPLRGKRCEPAFVIHTARKLAEVKGISFEEVCSVTSRNALNLFSTMRHPHEL